MTTTKEQMIKTALDKAEKHWRFIEECLNKFSDPTETFNFEVLMGELEWAFIHGFTHGYKHGLENHINE